MKAYVFQAALLCEECGESVKKELDAAGKRPANPNDESTFDSNDYPKGPYPDGGGESDYPQHCHHCPVFLGNPLTDEGRRYIRKLLVSAPHTDVLSEWAEFYGFVS